MKALSLKVILLGCEAMQLSLHSDRLQSGRPSNRGSIPGWSKSFISSPKFLVQLESTQPPSPWITRVPPPAVKRSRYEADH
jgi:hypothetical protein